MRSEVVVTRGTSVVACLCLYISRPHAAISNNLTLCTSLVNLHSDASISIKERDKPAQYPVNHLGVIRRPGSIRCLGAIAIQCLRTKWCREMLSMSSKISHEHPSKSSFESSLLGERMRGRHQFSNESATPLRIQRSTALIQREYALGYVVVYFSPSDLTISPASATRSQPGGRAGMFSLVTADRKDPACIAWRA